MKKILSYIMVSLLLSTISYAETADVYAKMLGNELAKMIPQKVDSATSLISVVTVGSEVNVTGTINHKELIKLDSETGIFDKKSKVRGILFPMLENNITKLLCNDPDTKFILDQGVIVTYSYIWEETYVPIGDISIIKRDCQ